LAQRFLRPSADDIKGILELVPVNLHAPLSRCLQLTEKLAGLLDVVALPFQPKPPVSGGHFEIELLFQCVQKSKIVRVQVLQRPPILKLKRF